MYVDAHACTRGILQQRQAKATVRRRYFIATSNYAFAVVYHAFTPSEGSSCHIRVYQARNRKAKVLCSRASIYTQYCYSVAVRSTIAVRNPKGKDAEVNIINYWGGTHQLLSKERVKRTQIFFTALLLLPFISCILLRPLPPFTSSTSDACNLSAVLLPRNFTI